MFFPGGGTAFTEVLFASVAEPNAQNLGYFVFLFVGEGVVQCKGAFAFQAAGGIVVRVPVIPCHPDQPVDFLYKGFVHDRFFGCSVHSR